MIEIILATANIALIIYKDKKISDYDGVS